MIDQRYGKVGLIKLPRPILPSRIDFRSKMSPVEDQGNLQTCSPNACVSVLEYLMKRENGHHTDVSRLFIYYNARRLKKPLGRLNDHGISLKYCIRALEKFGVCEEEYWPYRDELVNRKPPEFIYKRAQQYTIVSVAVPINIKSFKTSLAHGELPMISIYLDPSAGTQAIYNEGRIFIPDSNANTVKTAPWHSVVFVGYDDMKRYFIVRNSWSSQWGISGYFYLPYEYFKHPNLIDVHRGAWTIRQVGMRPKNLHNDENIKHYPYTPSPISHARFIHPNQSSELPRKRTSLHSVYSNIYPGA